MGNRIEEYRFRVGCRYPALRELLQLLPVKEAERPATDGTTLYYEADPLWEDYLHTLVHILCGHAREEAGKFLPVWGLACDLAAEYIRSLLFPFAGEERLRQDVRAVLPEGGSPIRAEDLYPALMNLYEDELEELRFTFTRDDHGLWRPAAGMKQASLDALSLQEDTPAPEPEWREEYISPAKLLLPEQLRQLLAKYWGPLLEQLAGDRETGGRWGLMPGSIAERAAVRQRNRLDFRRYLRRFSVFGEELRPDEECFDQIPYTFGLRHYGNLPLVEPLEYSDCFRVEDLIIAIDTSGSCSVGLVQEFLGEIRNILLKHDAFFRRMNVHLVQCDAYIREHTVIRSREDWDRYAESIEIRGRRGTDFRPVFLLAQQLLEEGELRRLKGLFYFTDGEGVYPEKEPPFETAFVYSEADALTRPGIPDWVTMLSMKPPHLSRTKTAEQEANPSQV